MNRLLLLGLLIYLIALAGLTTLNGGILALVIPVLIFLGAGLLYGPEKIELELTRNLSADRAEPNAAVIVTLSVTNVGPRLEMVQIMDAPPPQLQVVTGETQVVAALTPGQSLELQYTLRGRRGRYDFGPVKIEATDLLGLLRRETVIPVPGHFELFIYPDVPRLERIPIRPRQTKAYAGTIPARTGGAGVEFFGVRHYQPGDSLRHINWRANARHQDQFFTNEFEQERVADVGIILDARQRTNVQLEDDSLFEYTIQAAAAVATSFLRDGNRVALLRYGDFLDWTIPGYGKLQQERILQTLARAQTGDSLVFDQLEYLPTRLFPPKSQLVLISPLVTDDAQFLPRLRARGYSVLIISPNPVDFETNLLAQNKVVETAARIARVERALLLRQLRQAGIQLFDWDVKIPFDQALGSALTQLRPHVERNLGIV